MYNTEHSLLKDFIEYLRDNFDYVRADEWRHFPKGGIYSEDEIVEEFLKQCV